MSCCMGRAQNLPKILSYILFITVMHSACASALSYRFNVEVTNSTNKTLEAVEVRWKTEFEDNAWPCWLRTEMLAGTSSEDRCFPVTEKNKNWKRQIKVEFSCPGQERRTLYFPRGDNWFDQNYTEKNKDRYSIKIRLTDC